MLCWFHEPKYTFTSCSIILYDLVLNLRHFQLQEKKRIDPRDIWPTSSFGERKKADSKKDSRQNTWKLKPPDNENNTV